MSRRQRRAQQNGASTTTTSNSIKSADDIPYARPDERPSGRRARPAKTLFELAEERRAQLLAGDGGQVQNGGGGGGGGGRVSAKDIVNVKINPDGTTSADSTDDDDISPLWDTVFLAASLSAVHFTLSVLTMHQYAEAVVFAPLVRATLCTALPFLTLAVHLVHGHLFPRAIRQAYGRWAASDDTRWRCALVYAARQTALLLVATAAGCHLIHLCNDRGYYAVMKHAPNVGTVWVYCVIELGLVGALLGVLGPVAWARWKGYELL